MTLSGHAGEDCAICAKHRGKGYLVGGPLIWEDEQILVFHRPPAGTGRVFLGHLFIETRRHVPYFDQLTDAEAISVGWAAVRSARAIRQTLDPEYVFAAIVGRGMAHFHQHVFARYRGTPEELDWMASNQWAEARMVARSN